MICWTTLNDPQLADVWAEDEAIGWIYQYFNDNDVKKMRDAAKAVLRATAASWPSATNSSPRATSSSSSPTTPSAASGMR